VLQVDPTFKVCIYCTGIMGQWDLIIYFGNLKKKKIEDKESTWVFLYY